MHPKLFHQPWLNSYGLCISIGLVLCFAVLRRYARVKGMNRAYAIFVEGNGYVAVLGGMGLGMLSQALFNYLKNPTAGFHLSLAMTVISGLLGGTGVYLLGHWLVGRRKYGARLIEVIPITPACMTIAHACGRVGCFFAGCCYGRPTESCFGVNFPALPQPVIPTQLIEAGFLFLLFAVLYHLAVRTSFKHTFVVYLVAYGAFRFIIEFLRGDERGALVGTLSPSQTLSLLLMVGAWPVYALTEWLLKRYRADASLTEKLVS